MSGLATPVSFPSARTLLRGNHETKLIANSCIARCSSRERSQQFIGTHNETLSVVAMRVESRFFARWKETLTGNEIQIRSAS